MGQERPTLGRQRVKRHAARRKRRGNARTVSPATDFVVNGNKIATSVEKKKNKRRKQLRSLFRMSQPNHVVLESPRTVNDLLIADTIQNRGNPVVREKMNHLRRYSIIAPRGIKSQKADRKKGFKSLFRVLPTNNFCLETPANRQQFIKRVHGREQKKCSNA